MEEFRRHPYWCPRGHPEGVYRLDVFFDYGAFPVWGRAELPAQGDRPARVMYGMAPARRIGISPGLAGDLRDWADWHDLNSQYGGGRSATAEEHAEHWAHGRVLADRLARETGAEVVYGKPAADDRDPGCPYCGGR